MTNLLKKTYKRIGIYPNQWYPSVYLIIVSSCGNKGSNQTNEIKTIGFSSDYRGPKASYDMPVSKDPNFKILQPALLDPYWIVSLEMDNAEADINQMLSENQNEIKFSFPIEQADYLPLNIVGWAPASQNIIMASREIFSKLEAILDIKITEVNTTSGLNNFAISQSIQPTTAGFSYFPNNFYELGSDIFISKEFSDPFSLPNGLTNYDYEVLLHEIGHALGLKHPFEIDRNNTMILNRHEDSTEFTAMSYDEILTTFDGMFRSLDLMTLTKLYGVNSTFNSGDDVYKFNNNSGIFLIDGNGIDLIDASDSIEDVYIDLRYGSHSYQGDKSTLITSGKQLTISHGSNIENIKTGLGNDTVVGNHLPNIISTGLGQDTIFAGNGSDIIYPGQGADLIDLSDEDNSQDTIMFETNNGGEAVKTVYGFDQDILGDIIDLTDFNLSNLNILPIVDVKNVPTGYIDGCLARVFGADLNDTEISKTDFTKDGILENLKLSDQTNAVLITANSQDTGEVQNLYYLGNSSGSVNVYHLSKFVGNYLDIDNWSADHFVV